MHYQTVTNSLMLQVKYRLPVMVFFRGNNRVSPFVQTNDGLAQCFFLHSHKCGQYHRRSRSSDRSGLRLKEIKYLTQTLTTSRLQLTMSYLLLLMMGYVIPVCNQQAKMSQLSTNLSILMPWRQLGEAFDENLCRTLRFE